jgi:hypothetical protein
MNSAREEGDGIGAQIAAAAGAGAAIARTTRAQAEIDKELKQLARENPAVHRAAVKFVEAEDAYLEAREDAARERAEAPRN